MFCFDKQVFLDYQNVGDLGRVHYINPGNAVFDSLVDVVRNTYREDMLKGTVLVSADDQEDYFAFFIKSQITDNRPNRQDDSIANEIIGLVQATEDGVFKLTSPAKFIDLHAPKEFAKPVTPPDLVNSDQVLEWSFNSITLPQFEQTQQYVEQDTQKIREYLETAFTQVIADVSAEINELQGKFFIDPRVQDKLLKKQERLTELQKKKQQRLDNLELMTQLSPKAPEVMGCAYVVPLSQLEYNNHYGMSRDDEAEAIAMQAAMEFEVADGWSPVDVSSENVGYDIRSTNAVQLKRYIEVKGRSGSDGSVMLSENEMNRLAQLGDAAWLYIVVNCKSNPELFRIPNPAKSLKFEKKTKGVQYFLPMQEWKSKVGSKEYVH